MTNFEIKLNVFEQALNDLLSTIAPYEPTDKLEVKKSQECKPRISKDKVALHEKYIKSLPVNKKLKVPTKLSPVSTKGKSIASQPIETKVVEDRNYPKKKCAFYPKSKSKLSDSTEIQTKEALNGILFQNSLVDNSKVSVEKLRKNIEQAVQVLKKNFLKLQNENVQLKGKVGDLIDENNHLRNKLMKNTCVLCNKDVNNTDDVIHKMKGEINTLRQERTFLINDLKEKENKLENMEKANKKWLSVLNSVLSNCDEQITKSKSYSSSSSSSSSDPLYPDCESGEIWNKKMYQPSKSEQYTKPNKIPAQQRGNYLKEKFEVKSSKAPVVSKHLPYEFPSAKCNKLD